MSNDSTTMKGTKNPGKLNTSFWETAFKDDKNKTRIKKKGPRKKKKTKMTAMWENKFEYKKQIKSISDPKATSPKSTSPKSTNNNIQNINNNINKVSLLAGKLNINPKGMMGGLPPSLHKKREERKDKDIIREEFARPIIPKSVQRKKATKKNIVSITNNEINDSLRTYLSESFTYDKYMILDANNLCLYLRDVALIDLSATSDKLWDVNILISAIKDVFGDKVVQTYGYNLKAI